MGNVIFMRCTIVVLAGGLLLLGLGALPRPSDHADDTGLVQKIDDLQKELHRLKEASISTAPPVGTILAWHMSLTGTPALDSQTWVPCDGQLIEAEKFPGSKYVGQRIPNLNGERRFLRGGAVSGTPQDQQFKSHDHAGSVTTSEKLPGEPCQVFEKTYNLRAEAPNKGFHAYTWCEPPRRYRLTIQPEGGDETRPTNMSVVWIVRIK